jgi:hypothetical protein
VNLRALFFFLVFSSHALLAMSDEDSQSDDLLQAILRKNLEIFDSALEEKQDSIEYIYLYTAIISQASPYVMARLLQRESPTFYYQHSVGDYRVNFLHLAAETNNLRAIDVLIAYRPELLAQSDFRNLLPSEYARFAGNFNTTFLFAIAHEIMNHTGPERLKKLIHEGRHGGFSDELYRELTILHCAAFHNNSEAIAVLIQEIPNIEESLDAYGRFAYEVAHGDLDAEIQSQLMPKVWKKFIVKISLCDLPAVKKLYAMAPNKHNLGAARDPQYGLDPLNLAITLHVPVEIITFLYKNNLFQSNNETSYCHTAVRSKNLEALKILYELDKNNFEKQLVISEQNIYTPENLAQDLGYTEIKDWFAVRDQKTITVIESLANSVSNFLSKK